MKKTFWGYDITETDEVIDSLRSQNDVLSAKLINLNMELSALKESGALTASAPKSTPTMPMPEIRSSISDEERRELEALRSTNQKLMDENNRLNSEMASVMTELGGIKAELDSAKTELINTKSELMGTKAELNSGRREMKDVGQLCLKAYSDMEEMKADVSGEMQAQIHKFSSITTEAGLKMAEALENIRNAKVQTTEYLISSYEAMLENLEVFVTQSNNIESTLSPIEEVKSDLVQRVHEMMNQSSTEMKKWLPEDYAYGGCVEGPDKDTRNLPPLLTKAIHNLRKYSSDPVRSSSMTTQALPEEPVPEVQPIAKDLESQPSSVAPAINKVIGIDTKVKAKDIFGKY